MEYPAQQYANAAQGANVPKQSTQGENQIAAFGVANESLNKLESRFRAALERLGHSFAPTPESTEKLAGVPNGLFGNLSEKSRIANMTADRLHKLMDTLDTFV